MRICPTCQRSYPDETEFCPRDGTFLPAPPKSMGPVLAAGLARRYRIIRELGAGGMGSVFLAEQIAVGNRLVALKVLLRKLLDDPEFLMRFGNEAASTGRIRHPNVVTIYESGQADDGTPYIGMEYLEGETLRQALQSRGAMPVWECAEILQQVARGLHAAHKLGIIHRDLKPDNIFLTRGDEGELIVKVVDFGIAKLLDSSTVTMTGVLLGTPAYMSSEQASGMSSEELDARSDVYSLGIVLYEMLTGRVPFYSDTPLGYIRKHMLEEPPAFRFVNPGLSVPPEVEEVVMKAILKDRDLRYQTAVEFAADFVKAVQAAERKRAPERSPSISVVDPEAVTPEPDTGPLSGVSAEAEPDVRYGATPTPPRGLAKEPGVEDERMAPSPFAVVSGVETETPVPPLTKEETEPAAEPLPSITPTPPPAVRRTPVLPPRPPTTTPTRRPSVPPPRPKKRMPILWLGVGGGVLALAVLLAILVGLRHPGKTPSVGMVYIPGGTFMMGRENSPDRAERPAHYVTVAPFYLDKTPVTNADYAEFMQATGHPPPSTWPEGTYPGEQTLWPVTGVTWDDAGAYAKWKGKRLPTEAEWEFAARGNDGRIYPWGNQFDPTLTNSEETGLDHPEPIGSHRAAATPFGILDMSGNVWQWCQDAYRPYPNGRLGFQVPITARAIRGGSFKSDKNHVTTTARNLDLASARSEEIGFRCAMSP